MRKVYLDNAATSFPKAPGVPDAVKNFLEQGAYNISRGDYAGAYGVAERVLYVRTQLAALFGCSTPKRVVFTSGVTAALNCALFGLLKSGDHVVTTSMEHNAVIRPLADLSKRGIEVSCAWANLQGEVDPGKIEELIRPNTRLVVMSAASNVTGTLLPVDEVGALCRERGLLFVVDAAQTAGVFDINVETQGIDVLAFPGHKGLLGPQGIGGMVLSERAAKEMHPVLFGGTGSFSHLEEMPRLLPDRFEAGTLNLPGIFGLSAALAFLEEKGLAVLRDHERHLTESFRDQIKELPGIRIVAGKTAAVQAAVVSLVFENIDQAEAARRLDCEFGIMTRCGLHCAPKAHQSVGTYPAGTVRFSFGWNTTEEEVNYAADALRRLSTEAFNGR